MRPSNRKLGVSTAISWCTVTRYWLPRRVSFHRYLGLEAFEVTEDRGDGEHAPIALEPQDTVLRGNITLNRELIPLIGMADIVDRDVVVLAARPTSIRWGSRLMPCVRSGPASLG